MTARRREGREARTDWRVRLRLDGFTLVEADLHTGRTHQIRVHFSALGCPVVGDTSTARRGRSASATQLLPPLDRNFLHCGASGFRSSGDRKAVEVRAPLPVGTGRLSASARQGGRHESASMIDAALKEFL